MRSGMLLIMKSKVIFSVQQVPLFMYMVWIQQVELFNVFSNLR